MVFHEVVCIDVVSAMATLPTEVWGQKGGVENPSQSVIQNIGGRERGVSTLMAQNLRRD